MGLARQPREKVQEGKNQLHPWKCVIRGIEIRTRRQSSQEGLETGGNGRANCGAVVGISL